MNSINLLPDIIKEEIRISKTNKGIFSAFLSLIVLGVVFALFIYLGYEFLRTKISKMDKEIQVKEESIKAFGNVEEEALNLKGRLDAHREIQKERVYWSKAIEEIAANVPPRLYLTNIKAMNEEKTRGRIMGNAEDKIAIASLIGSLKENGMLQYIDIENVMIMEDPFVKGRDTNNFTISFTLNLEKIK